MEIFVSTSVKMDDARKAEIEKLADQGKNSAQISKLMGILLQIRLQLT